MTGRPSGFWRPNRPTPPLTTFCEVSVSPSGSWRGCHATPLTSSGAVLCQGLCHQGLSRVFRLSCEGRPGRVSDTGSSAERAVPRQFVKFGPDARAISLQNLRFSARWKMPLRLKSPRRCNRKPSEVFFGVAWHSRGGCCSGDRQNPKGRALMADRGVKDLFDGAPFC
jgi:hypothetical protein